MGMLACAAAPLCADGYALSSDDAVAEKEFFPPTEESVLPANTAGTNPNPTNGGGGTGTSDNPTQPQNPGSPVQNSKSPIKPEVNSSGPNAEPNNFPEEPQ